MKRSKELYEALMSVTELAKLLKEKDWSAASYYLVELNEKKIGNGNTAFLRSTIDRINVENNNNIAKPY
jgi:hypothetical protein